MSYRTHALKRADATNPGCITLTRDGMPLLKTRIASTYISRLRGLLWQCSPGPGEALLIKPCHSIHTYGMNYTIDVVFLDKAGRVLKLETVMPLSSASCKESSAVLEMASGEVNRLHLIVGQSLLVRE